MSFYSAMVSVTTVQYKSVHIMYISSSKYIYTHTDCSCWNMFELYIEIVLHPQMNDVYFVK